MKALVVKNLDDDLHRRVRARAALEGRTLRGVVLELLTAYAEGRTAGAPPRGGDAVLKLAGSLDVPGLADAVDDELYGD